MLVLSRAVNEEVVIDDSIRVKILKGGQGRVHLGISAPREIPVRRAELPPDGSADSHERLALGSLEPITQK